jgi:single-strand DNA-binding protein
LLYVEGRLHTSSWTDEQSGEKRYRTEVVAQEVGLLDSRRSDDQAEQPDDQPAPALRRRARVTKSQRAAADDLF